MRVSAWSFLGFWFLYQLFEANFGLLNARAHGGGVAFFAHVGGFVFGVLAALLVSPAAPAHDGASRFARGAEPRRRRGLIPLLRRMLASGARRRRALEASGSLQTAAARQRERGE